MIVKILKKRKNGAAAMEWVIQFPLIILVFILVLFLAGLFTTYTYFNNMSNKMAQDMNLIDYNDYIGIYDHYHDTIPTVVQQVSDDISTLTPMDRYVNRFMTYQTKYAPVEVASDDDWYKDVITYAILKNQDHLLLPGVQIKKVTGNISKNAGSVTDPHSYSDFRDCPSFSGCAVRIYIEYNYFGFDFLSDGFSIIS